MPVHTTSRVIATQNTETYHPPRRDSLAHILLLIRTNRMTQGARHLPGKAPNHWMKRSSLGMRPVVLGVWLAVFTLVVGPMFPSAGSFLRVC